MKTRIVGISGGAMVLVIGLMLLAGRMQGRQSDTDLAQTTPAAPAGEAVPASASASESAVLPPAPAAISAAPAPAGVALSKGAADIARFAQAGIGEDVILAYIGNVNSKFNLGSDQIVYLNDLGVSGTVVKAMIERDAVIDVNARAAAASLAAAAQPPPQPPLDTNPPPPPDDNSYPPAPPMDDSTATLPPYDPNTYASSDDSEYFYNSLAPYGSWVYVAGCGICWRPTVCVANHGWRPYCDRGRWLYSDCGWYWQSDYTWGWAAFHYGRWSQDAHYGWVWRPDRVWGPAWVSWRQSSDYCGWAPLPPSARFLPGTGFVYANHPVASGFEFGLKPAQYTYIPIGSMTDYAPTRYAAPAWQVDQIHGQTQVITQASEQNHHVVFRGVDPALVSALARKEVRRAEVREVTHNPQQPVQAEHLGHSGGGLVIYRPQLPTPTRRPAVAPIAPASRGSGLPKSSAAPVVRDANRLATTANPGAMPFSNEAALVQQRNDEFIARLTALNKAAAAQRPAETETYPPGSLVLRGSQSPNLASISQPSGYVQPQRTSSAEYSVVNGFARPNYSEQHVTPQHAPAQSQSAYVIPGRYTAAQHMTSASTPYWIASTPASSTGRSEAANIPGRFTANERLNTSSTQGFGAGMYSPPAHSHSEPTFQASSHVQYESHTESHAESHSEPAHESYSSHSPSSSSSSSSSSRK